MRRGPWWRWLALIVGIVATLPALAARVELEARTTDLAQGQTVWLLLQVIDGRPTSIPRIDAPDGLEIQYARHSFVTRSINFKVLRAEEFYYQVTALTPGDHQVGPVSVDLGGQVLTSEALVFHVRERPPSSTGEAAEVFARFDTGDAWEGQVVVYSYGYRSRVQIYRNSWTLPPLEGLVAPRDGRPEYKEFEILDPDGRIWANEAYQPLVATGIGRREVPGAVARLEVDASGEARSLSPFRPSKQLVVATDAHTLNVRALPPAPAGFSGLVGDFQFTSQLNGNRARVGESVDWQIRVVGNGSLEGFSLERMSDVEGARIYDGTPTVGARVQDGRYAAEGVFSRVVVPTQVGTLTLPAATVVTFSPSKGEYVTHELGVKPISVVSGGEGAASIESFNDGSGPRPEYIDEGIRDIWTTGRAHAAWLGPVVPWMLGVAAAPAVVLALGQGMLSLFGLARRSLGRRAAPAPPSPTARLARLPAAREERLAELDAILRQCLAGRAGVQVGELDRGAAVDGLDDALAERVRGCFEWLDRVRFAGGVDDEGLEAEVVGVVRALR